jgi:hypothetical protein
MSEAKDNPLITFRDTMTTPPTAPPWFLSQWGIRVLYSLGIQWDAIVDAMVQGVLQRFPEKCQPYSLPYIGVERRIQRGFAESASQYVARLMPWLDDIRVKGGPFALMDQLRGYLTGYNVPMRIVNNAGCWASIEYDGTRSVVMSPPASWDWDGDAALWSRYWLIMYPPIDLWTSFATSTDIGTRDTVGSTITQAQVQDIFQIVMAWNPPHANCVCVILAFDGGSFSPYGTPGTDIPNGNWGKWGSGNPRVINRLQTARYMFIPTAPGAVINLGG